MAIYNSAAVAFIISAVLIMLLRRFAPALGLMDHPTGRKAHMAPVPVVGGAAMFVAFVPLSLVALPDARGLVLVLALAALVLTGTLDDRFLLRPRYRFVAEIAAALLLACNGQAVLYLGNLLGMGPISTGAFGVVFSVVCYVGLTNACNMVDGIDGLAASLVLVATLFFTSIAIASGQWPEAAVGATTIGALVAFQLFNLRTRWRTHAAIFMGDAGSMFLGCLLAWFAIVLAGHGPGLLTPIGAVWIVAVPLLDMGSVMLHRLREGRSPFDGDRRHFHYLLIDSGHSVSRAVALLTAAAVLCGAIGIGFPLLHIPEWAMFIAFLAAWFLAYRVVSRTEPRVHGGAARIPTHAPRPPP